MTPWVDVLYLDMEDAIDDNRRKIQESTYSVLPVCRGGIMNILGAVHAKDLLARSLLGEPLDLLSSLKPLLFVPETSTAMKLLEMFKKSGRHMAVAVDEYGNVQGLVTVNDVLESIVGDIPTEGEPEEPLAVRREDGSWLLDGMLPADQFRELFPDVELPEEESGTYHTLSGFVLMRLGRIPMVPDHFEWRGWRFEVVDMDVNRIDKVWCCWRGGFRACCCCSSGRSSSLWPCGPSPRLWKNICACRRGWPSVQRSSSLWWRARWVPG